MILRLFLFLFLSIDQYYFSGFPNRSEIFVTLEETLARKLNDSVAAGGARAVDRNWVWWCCVTMNVYVRECVCA